MITLSSFLLFASSCDVGSNYQPIVSDVPPEWKNASQEETPTCYADFWWEVFDNPLLNSLEQQAIENNYTLGIAYNRVEEARSLTEVAASDFYPQLYLNPYYNNEGVLYESYSDGVVVRSHQVLYLLPLDLDYELDLWGKIRNQYFAAQENWESRIEAYHFVMLILTTDLAATFYQIRTWDAQLDLLDTTIKNREKELKITNSRFKAKVTDYTDVTRASLELSNAIASYREASRIRAELENRLAVLVGAAPSEFCFEHYPLQGLPPQIPAGLPSDVLLRRPDIAEAERNMAAQHSLANVAYASFFPSVTLTGAAGYSSPHIRFFIKNFSRLWAFGAKGSQMVFDGGKLSGDLAYHEFRFREANDNYRQIILTSFEEVEDALSNIEKYAREFDDISTSVEWAQRTYRIASNRYKNGITSYLDVVIAEQEELTSQIQLNDLQGLCFVSTIQLIKAIGGGWDCCSGNSLE